MVKWSFTTQINPVITNGFDWSRASLYFWNMCNKQKIKLNEPRLEKISRNMLTTTTKITKTTKTTTKKQSEWKKKFFCVCCDIKSNHFSCFLVFCFRLYNDTQHMFVCSIQSKKKKQEIQREGRTQWVQSSFIVQFLEKSQTLF